MAHRVKQRGSISGQALDPGANGDQPAANGSAQLADDVELMVAREDLLELLLACLGVLLGHDLRVVFQDVRQARGREDAFPQVVGHQALRVRGVASAVLVALVKGQEPRRLVLQLRAEAHHLVVHREVRHAATELKQQLPGITIALVLLDGILRRLLGDVVLEFKCGDR